jgi:hypothetical protein
VANDKGDGEDLFEDLDKFFAPIRDVDWDEPEEATEHTPHESHVEVRSEEPPEATQELPATDGESEDAWDDPAALEPIDDILGEPVQDEAGGDDVVVIDAGESANAGGSERDVFEPDETSSLEGEPSEEDLEAAAAHFSGSLAGDSSYATEPVDALGGSEVGDLLSDLGAPPSGSSEDVEADLLSDLQDPDAAPRTVVVGAEGISGPSWQEPAAVLRAVNGTCRPRS